MKKIRVYELAKEFRMTSKNLITKLNRLGIDVTNHMSVISPEDHQKFLDFLNPGKPVEVVPPTAPPQVEIPAEPIRESAPETLQEKTIEKKEEPIETKRPPQHGDKREARPTPATSERKAPPKKETVKKDHARPAAKAVEGEGKEAVAPRSKRPPRSARPVKEVRPEVEEVTPEEEENKRKSFRKKKRGTHAQYKKVRDDSVDLSDQTVAIDETITLAQLAEELHRPATELIMKFMELGEMYTMNSAITFDNAALVAMEFGINLEQKQSLEEIAEEEFDFEDDENKLVERAPIVTVMGHVDHGKTSLLDAIRNTNITKREAGGITQHIGASEVTHKGKRIVFLDTPGHEAFTTLRARGAQVTDIAILVVAADDGVKPQTVEAIHHAREAGVPIIIAINKMDKPAANPERVKQELTEHQILVEDYGGEVICVEVSALKGQNIDQLLEMILLVAEMGELKADPRRRGVGTIIEANVSKSMGITATVLLEKGSMKIGDHIFAGAAFGRVRTMVNDKGRRMKGAGPSSAFEITGLSSIPQAGDKIYVTSDDQTARSYAERNSIRLRENKLANTRKVASLDNLFDGVEEGEKKQLNIILRADVHGSVEAIRQSIEHIENDEVSVNLIKAQVGAITESDILLATASEAIIMGFNVRPNNSIQAIAERESVEIRTYRIIYDIINDIRDAISGMLAPEQREEVEGNIEVRNTFRVPGAGTIAGGYVQKGKISRSSQVRLIRDGIVIYEGEVSSLKRFKDDVRQVNTGYECGIGLKNYNDIKEGDVIETFIIREIERTLDS